MTKKKVKIKKLDDRAQIPTYGSEFSAGADLYAIIDGGEVEVTPGETVLIRTGIALEIPEEYLEKSGLLGVSHLTLAHGVWIDEGAMDFYAKDNITIAHCPKSNLKLGSGVANVPALLRHGVSLAIGTDGAASNNRLDMWDEMRFAALLQKGLRNDPTQMASRDVLRMATLNGARALGFDRVGLIKEGWAADFMLVDLDQPQYVGWDCGSLSAYLVYAGSSSDVRETVVAGEPLYQDGEFTTLDRSRIISEAAAERNKLTGK